MNNHLLREPIQFFIWYFFYLPKRLYIIGYRIIVILNNDISLTLNFRLLFTPLYGDYTVVGRLFGFVVRIFQIFFGTVMMLILAAAVVVTPVLWIFLPAIIFYYLKFWAVLYVFALFALRIYLYLDVPYKRVKHVNESNPVPAFRPSVLTQFHKLEAASSITPKFLNTIRVAYLLKKLELVSPEFLEKLSSTTLDFGELEKRAYKYAVGHKSRYVEMEHLFLACISLVPKVDLFLSVYDSSLHLCEEAAQWLVHEREKDSKITFWQEDFELPKMSGIGKGMTGHVTPFLNTISEDFTKQAQKGYIRDIVCHKDKMDEVIELLGSSNSNVLLIGPPGCGKTSVIKGIAERVIRGTDVGHIRFKRIVALDTSSLLAGARSVGEVSEKVRNLMKEVRSSKDIILFFDEIHNLVSGAQGEDATVIFSVLEPYLSGSDIQFIGATNLRNYRKHVEPNGAFARLFELVEIPEASEEDTIDVLETNSVKLERKYKIDISYPALVEIVKLSKKLIHERVFPDKALDILNRVVTTARKTNKYVEKSDVRAAISDYTHIPVTSLSEDESNKLLSIEDEIKKRVIGQDHAVSQIAKALQRARVGIRDESKPIASFLFVGTTGVGKTETAKALAEKYFGDEEFMIRIDMSEYQEQDSIKRLIGDPGGNRQGILTEAVRKRPYSLILLDEIEKAYSSILLMFLQVLDDGRLTDAEGTTVDFSNAIIIATSNVGTRVLQDVASRGGTQDEMNKVALKEVRGHYAPEFLNRFDGLIVYRPLSADVVKKIADLMLNRVRKMADEKNIKVSFKDELIDELVKRGFSNEWGARELGRVISDSVETYLARKLLSKEIKMGDSVELGVEVFSDN